MVASINKMTIRTTKSHTVHILCGLLVATVLSALIQPSGAQVMEKLLCDAEGRTATHLRSCNDNMYRSRRRLKEDDSCLKIEGINTQKLKRNLDKLVRTGQAIRVTPAWLANIPTAWRNNYIAHQATCSPRKPTKGKSSKKKKDGNVGGGFEFKMNAAGILTGLKIGADATKTITGTLENMTGQVTKGTVDIVFKLGETINLMWGQAAQTAEHVLNTLLKDQQGVRATRKEMKQMEYAHSTTTSERNQAAYFKCIEGRSIEDIKAVCAVFAKGI